MDLYDEYAAFMFELGMLKRVQREGWKLLGISNPEYVGLHSLRAAQIGYVLAKLEECENPEKICTMLVFHDIGECRVGDIHKVANRYVHVDEACVVHEQLDSLGEIGKSLFLLWDEMEKQQTVAGVIAKDADLLEMVVTACELKSQHVSGVDNWLMNTEKRLKTKSAKDLFQRLVATNPNTWWKDLKKI